MDHFKDVIRDDFGNVRSNVTVTVLEAGTTSVAQIFSDNGVTTKTNPFLSGTKGEVSFYYAGRVDLKLDDGSTIVYCRDIVLSDPNSSMGTLNGLSDVDTSGVNDNEILSYDSASNTWVPMTSATGVTNLALGNHTSTNLQLTSSSGNDAVIPSATTALAGLISAADKMKLDGIQAGATDDQSGTEIVSAIDSELGSSTWQGGGGVGATDLDYTVATRLLESSTGDNVTLPLVDATNPGLMTSADKSKLDNIDANAADEQTGSELVSSLNSELGGNSWQSGGSGSTDLSYTASSRLLESSSGNNVNLPEATTSNAGLLAAADKTKLNAIEASATADQDADEVPYTGSAPSNYSAASANVEAHLEGIDTALASAGGVSSATLTNSGSTAQVRYSGTAPTYAYSAGTGTLSIPSGSEVISVTCLLPSADNAGSFTLVYGANGSFDNDAAGTANPPQTKAWRTDTRVGAFVNSSIGANFDRLTTTGIPSSVDTLITHSF